MWSKTVNTDWFPFEDQSWRTKQSEISTWVFVGKITVTTYTCRYDPVSLDLSVTTGPRDSPHRRGSVSCTGPLESVSRGPLPNPRSLEVRYRTRRQCHYDNIRSIYVLLYLMIFVVIFYKMLQLSFHIFCRTSQPTWSIMKTIYQQVAERLCHTLLDSANSNKILCPFVCVSCTFLVRSVSVVEREKTMIMHIRIQAWNLVEMFICMSYWNFSS